MFFYILYLIKKLVYKFKLFLNRKFKTFFIYYYQNKIFYKKKIKNNLT